MKAYVMLWKKLKTMQLQTTFAVLLCQKLLVAQTKWIGEKSLLNADQKTEAIPSRRKQLPSKKLVIKSNPS